MSDGQRAKIFAAARELGLSNAVLHRLLEQVAGRTSIRDLTKDEARLFIDVLVDAGASGQGRNFVPSAPARGSPRSASRPLRVAGDNIVRLATHEQLEKIGYLVRDLELTWDASKFLTVVARATGKSRIRTTRDASRVIDALTAIARRQMDGGSNPAA